MSAACVCTHLYICARSTSSTLDTRSLDDYRALSLSLSFSLSFSLSLSLSLSGLLFR
jgi:hypothetical protein